VPIASCVLWFSCSTRERFGFWEFFSKIGPGLGGQKICGNLISVKFWRVSVAVVTSCIYIDNFTPEKLPERPKVWFCIVTRERFGFWKFFTKSVQG